MSDNRISDESQALRNEIRRLRKSLSELTPPVDILLKRRGFRIYKKEPSEDLLLPEDTCINSFYDMLKKYSFRLFLREVIKHQKFFKLEHVTRYATSAVTNDYLHYMIDIGLVGNTSGGFKLLPSPIKSFGETLEWFIAEIFKVEFAVEAIWDLQLRRSGGYDSSGPGLVVIMTSLRKSMGQYSIWRLNLLRQNRYISKRFQLFLIGYLIFLLR
jgi:hypothetical protein